MLPLPCLPIFFLKRRIFPCWLYPVSLLHFAMRLQLSCPPWKKLRVACISEFPQRQVATARGRTCCNAIHDFTPVWNKPATPPLKIYQMNSFICNWVSVSGRSTHWYYWQGGPWRKQCILALSFSHAPASALQKGEWMFAGITFLHFSAALFILHTSFFGQEVYIFIQ